MTDINLEAIAVQMAAFLKGEQEWDTAITKEQVELVLADSDAKAELCDDLGRIASVFFEEAIAAKDKNDPVQVLADEMEDAGFYLYKVDDPDKPDYRPTAHKFFNCCLGLEIPEPEPEIEKDDVAILDEETSEETAERLAEEKRAAEEAARERERDDRRPEDPAEPRNQRQQGGGRGPGPRVEVQYTPITGRTSGRTVEEIRQDPTYRKHRGEIDAILDIEGSGSARLYQMCRDLAQAKGFARQLKSDVRTQLQADLAKLIKGDEDDRTTLDPDE